MGAGRPARASCFGCGWLATSMLQGGRAGTSPLLLCLLDDTLVGAEPLNLCLPGSCGPPPGRRRCYDLYMGSAPDSPPHCWICGPGHAGHSPLLPSSASRVVPRWRLSTSAAGPSWLRPAASRDHHDVWARAGELLRQRAAGHVDASRRTGGDVSPAPVHSRRHARPLTVYLTGSRGSLLCCRRCYYL